MRLPIRPATESMKEQISVESPLARLEQELRQVVRTSSDAVRMALVAVLAEGHP